MEFFPDPWVHSTHEVVFGYCTAERNVISQEVRFKKERVKSMENDGISFLTKSAGSRRPIDLHPPAPRLFVLRNLVTSVVVEDQVGECPLLS